MVFGKLAINARGRSGGSPDRDCEWRAMAAAEAERTLTCRAGKELYREPEAAPPQTAPDPRPWVSMMT